ncbi:MAG: hypothetical protein ACPGR7_06190 [Flavobacteriaceae bacterium]|nr:hypothetical protein [Flavobacteriaceae bacterium]
MKKILLILSVVLLGSCSAVTVADSWKNTDMNSLKGEKMAVIARTADNVVRTRIEKDMVSSLNEAGFEAVGSYTKLPAVDPNKKLDPKKVEIVRQAILDQGYKLVVMVVLKDKENYMKSTSDYNGYGYPGYPGYYGAGFYRGFGTYYGSLYNYGYSTTTTTMAKKYIVETVVYDISKPEGKSLIAVVTTDIDDPTSLSKTAADLAKKVTYELMRK